MSQHFRGYDDIERAHDLLAAIIAQDATGLALSAETLYAIHSALDVLCWVLVHDHNTAFAGNLTMLEEAIMEAGYVPTRLPRPMTRTEAREEGYIE
jgi:hypothetical protein